MSKGWFSRLSNEQKTTYLIFFITAITALATAIPISVSIWFANDSWVTKTISISIFIIFASIIFSAIFFDAIPKVV